MSVNPIRKPIKVLLKIALSVALGLIALVMLVVIAVQFSVVQTFLVRIVAGQLSEQLRVPVRVAHVNFRPFNHLILEGVYVEDQSRDTLLYIGSLDAGIRRFKTSANRFAFGTVRLDSLRVKLNTNKQGISNLEFILQRFRTAEDTTRTPIPPFVTCARLEISHSGFSFRDYRIQETPGVVNFADIVLSLPNLEMKSVCMAGDSVMADFVNLGLDEKSGFQVDSFSGFCQYSPRGIQARDLRAQTALSDLDIPQLEFICPKREPWSGFLTRMQIHAVFRNTSFSFRDIAYFSKEVEGMESVATLSGSLRGTVADFRARNLDIKYGADTHFKGKVTMKGLPDFYETFILSDVEILTTSRQDILNFTLPVIAGAGPIPVPEELNLLGRVEYTGNFTGFPADFVAFGTLQTNLGEVSTDLLLKQIRGSNRLDFSGKIATRAFEMQPLLGARLNSGRLSAEARVAGHSVGKDSLVAHVDGKISQVGIFGYNYANIDVRGDLVGKKFDGFIYINDPNLDLSVYGGVDWSTAVPDFDFNAIVNNANLFPLHLYSADSLSAVSFGLKAAFSGTRPDQMAGQIHVFDLSYRHSRGTFSSGNLTLISEPGEQTSRISLQSDLLNFSLSGRYQFETLPAVFSSFAYHYFPGLFDSRPVTVAQAGDDFSFTARLGETSRIIDAFVPGLRVAEGSTMEGSFNAASGKARFQADFPLVAYGDFQTPGLKVRADGSPDGASAVITGSRFETGTLAGFSNFEIKTDGSADTVRLLLDWTQRDKTESSGHFKGFVVFQDETGQDRPVFRIGILPSRISLGDSTWNFSTARALVDSGRVEVTGLEAVCNSQKVKIFGAVSANPSEILNFELENFELGNFAPLTSPEDLLLTGVASGKATLGNLYSSAIFDSDIRVTSLKLNNDLFGTAWIQSKWFQDQRKMNFHVFTLDEKIKRVDLAGAFFPATRAIDCMVRLDRFNLRVLEPYLDGLFSDLAGIASDSVHVFGTVDKPEMDGSLKIQKAALTVDYLKTRYFFSDKVRISSSGIHFDRINLTDSRGKNARLTGAILHKNLSDFRLDLEIDATDFHVLNTREPDNPLFYGTAYATGKVRITGPFDAIVFDAAVQSNRDTRFFVPLLAEGDIEESSFVSFVKPPEQNSGSAPATPDHPKNLNLKMNFNLEVTPEALVQIIFNSRTGDIIQGNGSGNLRMVINTTGDFNMFGEYVINEGEYTFTLQNLFSKRFKVKNGGNIRWNGDPADAMINIEAVYPISASLDGLLMDTSYTYRQKIPVECRIFLTDRLLNPTIRFALDLPEGDGKERALLANLPEDEINKQFLSLILINRFQPLNYLSQGGYNATGTGASDFSRTTSEFLSNQLSHWLSQINQDFDIGLNYKPGDQLTPQQIDVALQTQLFDDRVRINGKMGVGGQYTYTNNIVGDLVVDLKLNQSGKVRLKAFHKTNNQIIYDEGPYTQGIGLFYREEFNDFDDLLRKLNLRK